MPPDNRTLSSNSTGESRKIIDCPRCDGTGSVKHSYSQTPMWWEITHLRCSWCGGSGRIYEEASDGEA